MTQTQLVLFMQANIFIAASLSGGGLPALMVGVIALVASVVAK